MPDFYEGRVTKMDYFKFVIIFFSFGAGLWMVMDTMNKLKKENSAYVDELTSMAKEENILRTK